MGLEHPALTQLEHNDQTIILHQAVVQPLKQLMDASAKAGLDIHIVSSWRSFQHQASIWNRKWNGERAVLDKHSQPIDLTQLSDHEKFKSIAFWSAVPGTSRHHWGTDFDLFLQALVKKGYSVQLVPEEFAAGGPCESLECWLQENLGQFEFFRPYQTYRGGVAHEPWHISYRPVSEPLLKNVEAKSIASQLMLQDVQGKQTITAALDDYLERYVFNIDD
nr:M15 family metallopeptidase [Pleionea sp. CnH1-48]